MRTLILGMLMLTGCVHQADLDAWQGVPVIELETHPLFASLTPEIRTLSDGSRLYVYFNGGDQLNEGMIAKSGCSNQFLVKNGTVVRYTPVSVGMKRCMTNCSVRPASRPCD